MTDQTTESKGAQVQRALAVHKGCTNAETKYLRVERTLNSARNSALQMHFNPEDGHKPLILNRKRKQTEEPAKSSTRKVKKQKQVVSSETIGRG